MNMKGKIRRVTVYLLILAVFCTMLAGCGLIQPTGLNENDEELVAEYAAGVLMRYSADKKGGLGNPKPTPKPTQAPAEEAVAPVDEPAQTQDEAHDIPVDENEEPKEAEETTDVSANAVTAKADGAAICDAIGIRGFEMTYKGYETADIYPRSDGNDLTFSMQAAPGKKLIVLHFDVMNPGSADAECNVLDCNVKFRILVNETNRINEQMTILLNDLKSYKDTIGAGQTRDTVLVFEADTSVAESIGSLSLIVVSGSGESAFTL